MTLDYLGLEYNYIEVDIMSGENRTPEFLALNPQHTVPVLVDGDGDVVITESRAAITYLVSQHKPCELYPACPKTRAQIDQRLYFNIGIFYKRFGDCVYPVAFGKTDVIDKEAMDALKEALKWVDMITAGGFVLGEAMTVADIDFMSTMSTLEACCFLDMSSFKNMNAWAAKMKTIIPKYEVNCGEGA